MHHTSARFAITRVLSGRGFGDRALALVTAASLGDVDQAALRLRQAALNRASDLPADTALDYHGPLLAAPIPRDEKELCHQLCPAVIEHPHDVGMQLACLVALAQLWPHVGSDERAMMRQRFLEGQIRPGAPADDILSVAQLCAWQRDLPTAFSEAKASVASLKGMLVESRPRDAYRVLAEHLGINADLATLSWVLGALTVQVRLAFHDPHRVILHALLGTIACERLAAWAMPEHLPTLISQLAYRIWWCRHQAQLPPIRTCLDISPHPLAEAVASGDLTVSQRSARAAAKQPEDFWNEVWRLLEERITHNDPHWTQALDIVVAIAWRTSGDVISPDDAAALGTVFADLAYREKAAPELAPH